MLKQRLEKAKELLQEPDLVEDDVQQFIVKPVLIELGWDVFNPSHIRPERKIDQKGKPPLFVDYALFATDRKHPSLIIEAERPGKIEAAVDQVTEYAYKLGGLTAAIAVDGTNWRFYLPNKTGAAEDRPALRLSLLDDDIEYLADLLPKVLQREAVASGSAKAELEESHRQTKVKGYFDQAWSSLLDSQAFTETVTEQFIAELRGHTRTVPRHDDARTFIQEELTAWSDRAKSRSATIDRRSPEDSGGDRARKDKGKPSRQRSSADAGTGPRWRGTLYVLGEEIECNGKSDALRKLLEWAQNRDPAFLSRLANKTSNVQRSTTQPTRTHRYQLGGYWIRDQHGKTAMEEMMRKCAEAAQLRWGTGIQVRPPYLTLARMSRLSDQQASNIESS